MILSSRLTLSVAVFASVPPAAIAQPVDTQGVASPRKLCPIDGPAMQSKLSSLELDQ